MEVAEINFKNGKITVRLLCLSMSSFVLASECSGVLQSALYQLRCSWSNLACSRVVHNHCLASVVVLQRSIILRFTGHHYSCAVLSGREISVAW